MALFGIGLDSGFNGVEESPGDSDQLVSDARMADRAGLDVVTVTDHPYHGGQLDAYATLGFVLGATTSVAGVVTMTNLPCRPAPTLARTVSGLSALSGGRIKLGIGAGVFWDDIVRLGVEPRTPAEAVRMLAEGITLLKALTGGGDPVTFDGEFYQVDKLAPAQVPTPPIWSGSMGPASLAVTGRLADAWMPAGAQNWRSDPVAESRAVIDKAAVAAGRDPSDIATVHNVFGTITDTPVDATRSVDSNGIPWLSGTVEQWTEELVSAIDDYRADGFVFFSGADAADEKEAAHSRWAHEIVPAVRAATSAG
ncbi:LLM class flavin-dependent oxidoreductase [Streptomonospora salina]|uniref:Alkanesulfonate monooxygenase SsuD/methylene tetrahydromethanopterin reductase-like flavin-dependent oxidoreductase (Luciferase family) n=1 Tax=Streptomonospora salina TaxID=104205 RepID=A0A841EBZ3_9ACTN|nr:LLM class flavin-dependent oxidoreductase [Streptomonospora salina]MBB5996961.1 alkanesulfonate monooxygenase SsuD/methylene tetrahydromethanopterin reductase-like flavin-dependent oxidoreductase (luciferase family) [Streptomonospora salina]